MNESALQTCPSCRGLGGSAIPFTGGLEITCGLCKGAGKIDADKLIRWTRGQALRDQRLTRGLTLAEAAKLQGISIEERVRIEKGELPE